MKDKNKKDKYEEPEMEIVLFSQDDLIVTSSGSSCVETGTTDPIGGSDR